MKFPVLLFISTFLPLLSSCGGGGTQVADGGVGGTGITAGKVTSTDTQTNTIIVNGVSFDTQDTSFIVEEAFVDDGSAIQVGMVVQVTGDHDGIRGVAEQVEYADLLEGVVTKVTPGKNSFTVMGQIVYVDANTEYANLADITALQINAVVEVSGYSGIDGILATRVEVKLDVWEEGDELEIKGIVTGLTQDTFLIGDLIVDWSTAIHLPDGVPQEGWYVEVKGDHFNDITGAFIANEVEKEGDGDQTIADDGTEVEIEGLVTSELVDNRFTLNGQPVEINASTVFDPVESGSSGIQPGVLLEVEGIMFGEVLVAYEIEFEDDD